MPQQLKKNNRVRWGLLAGMVLLILWGSDKARSEPETGSLSDLSFETEDTAKPESQGRNPFSPGATEGNIDPSSLALEGIVAGVEKKLCLISGRILKEGDGIGSFVVKNIQPGTVTVQSVKGVHALTMESYLERAETKGDTYEIIFQSADLKEALRMLATAGGFNMIVPETAAGRVSLIFHQTPLKEALASILRVNGLEYAEENDIIRVGKPEDFAGGSYFTTRHIALRYASAKDLIETLKYHLSEKGTITYDTRTNAIIIKDSQSISDKIASLVTHLDKQDTQVRIEARIVDVTKNFSRSLGIQWGFTKASGQVQGFGGPTIDSLPDSDNPLNINLPATNPTSGVGILVGNLANQTDLQAQITAAEEKGDAHILSQPSVTTVNNTPAKIRSGLKIYVKTTSSIVVGGSGGSASGGQSGLEEIDTGIELTVTPQITTDNTIKLKIEAEESQADFTRTVDGIPAIIDNTASTTVLVNDSETTVIGGLMKINKTNSTRGVPFISSVPVVGWLFKTRTKSKSDNELLIFITPSIVREARQVAKKGVRAPSNEVIEEQVIQVDSSPKKKKKRHKHQRER